MPKNFGVQVKTKKGRWRWLKPNWFLKKGDHRVASLAAADRLAAKYEREHRAARVRVPRVLRISKRRKLLAAARSQLGVVESPAGSNSGPRVRMYQSSTTVAGTGWPWCQAFVHWCSLKAGVKLGYKGAYVPHFEHWAKQNGRWISDVSKARPGDAVVFGFGSRLAVHVGLLEKALSPHTIISIEGNTSSGATGSQNNGGGVYRRSRATRDIRGYVRMT